MTLSADDFTRQMQALLPPGKAWSRSQSSLITKALQGAAPEFARVQGRGDDILREMNPGEAVEMLPEHESLNGIVASGTTSQRQAALLAKLQDTAGHNPADYTAWAAALGYPGVVVRRRPIPPFRAGDLAGYRAHGKAWAHAHIVEYMPDILTPAANDFGAWTPVFGTVTANQAQGPDGIGLTADVISDLSIRTAAVTSSNKPRFSIWAKAWSGSPTLGLAMGSASAFFPLQTWWKRFEIQSPDSSVSAVSLNVSGGAALAWGAYAGAPIAAFESAFYARQQAHAAPLFRVIGDYPKD